MRELIGIKQALALLLLLTAVASGQTQRRREPPQRELFPAQFLPPLMRAAQAGRLDKVRVLVKGGADVNEKFDDLGGITALMVAAGAGHIEVVKELLAAGADPNASAGIAHVGFFTPLVMAMNRRTDKNRLKLIDTLIAGGAQLNPPIWFHESPLCTALHMSDMELVKALIERGSDVNWENQFGTTPLHAAVTDGNAEVAFVRLLLDAGTDPNKPRLWTGDDCVSILEFLDDQLKMSREMKLPRDSVREEMRRLIIQRGGKKFRTSNSQGKPCKSW
jgi:uncharacterized protein